MKCQGLPLLHNVGDVLIFLPQTRFCGDGCFQHYSLSENMSKMGFAGGVD